MLVSEEIQLTENRPIPQQTMVVILAAGKGTRMGQSDMTKVCFEIDGVPAIDRQISVFKKLGFKRFLLVVGSRAEQVLKTVESDHEGVLYAFQEKPLGTGNAAKVAAAALRTIDHQGCVLITAGDSHLEPEAIETLVSGYVKQRADMALVMALKPSAAITSKGRILVDPDGQVLAIIESVDLARQTIVDRLKQDLTTGIAITGKHILDVVSVSIPQVRKREAAAGELLTLAKERGEVDPVKLEQILVSDHYNIRLDGRRFSARDIEKQCQGENQSMYLFRSDVFYQGVGMIDNDNAQHEFYLTDAVRNLAESRNAQGARAYRVRAIPVGNPDWVQGFNSPDELVAIQDYVRRKKLEKSGTDVARAPRLKANQYCTPKRWLEKIEARTPAMNRWLRNTYGTFDELHTEKARDLTRLLKCYGKRFGLDEKVCVVRAPGQVNLMGRHVDHRGGMTNFLAIDRETIAVAGLRDDYRVVAVNTQPKKFPAIEFSIQELLGRFAWSDWLDFVNSDWVRNMIYAAPGDWGHYIRAAILRLQHRFQDVKIRGLNLAVSGNLPVGAGLSSSSTIVVATLQAAIALNEFELASQQFIDLCGEGEWFVGSRKDAGGHAAIYLGQRGKIAQVGYLPFRVERIIDAPSDYQVVLANSHVKAAQNSTAKHVVNARVADYSLGLALLKQRCPEIEQTVEYLRDVNPDKLGCRTSDIYRMLLKIPERMTRKEFRDILSREHRQMMEENFATHSEPEFYHPRRVLLYGIAEIIRSKMCVDLLEQDRVGKFGGMMSISHDGDRVSRPAADGDYEPIEVDCGDAYLHRLIVDLGSEDPDRVLEAQLYMQAGSYACSTPEIDQMVDIASSVPGVAGAQIAGAGLGGCIMVLAKKEAVRDVRKALVQQYYRPAGLKPAVLPCIAVEGAGLVAF